eukprot:scaffold306_cov525-Prasinococcus_capsulatus_cf.AAC.60
MSGPCWSITVYRRRNKHAGSAEEKNDLARRNLDITAVPAAPIAPPAHGVSMTHVSIVHVTCDNPSQL